MWKCWNWKNKIKYEIKQTTTTTLTGEVFGKLIKFINAIIREILFTFYCLYSLIDAAVVVVLFFEEN